MTNNLVSLKTEELIGQSNYVLRNELINVISLAIFMNIHPPFNSFRNSFIYLFEKRKFGLLTGYFNVHKSVIQCQQFLAFKNFVRQTTFFSVTLK